MVKIAVAGGSGHIAREVIDVLVATKKHEILILSRRKPSADDEKIPAVTWVTVDYKDTNQLTKVLGGVHTVLSFIVAHNDPGSVSQKALIDAAITAGVKRFAPNEWSGSSIEELPWYAEKGHIREYLQNINRDKKVLEYTLFQPGLIVDYLVPRGSSSKYLEPLEVWIDFFHRRAITIEDATDAFTLTTLNDLVNVVARAVDYSGEWPVVGGVQGTTLSTSKIIDIGVRVRGGKPWDITYLKEEDVRADNIQTSWVPIFRDPNLTPEQIEQFSKVILKGSLLSGICGSWVVSDGWNRLLPDYKFGDIEEFLQKHWAGRD